jgi:hypothetical protein
MMMVKEGKKWIRNEMHRMSGQRFYQWNVMNEGENGS